MCTKKLLLAVALLATFSGPAAQAAVSDWGSHDVFEAGFGVGSGSISDVFAFSLPAAGQMAASAISGVLMPVAAPFSGQVDLYQGAWGGSSTWLGGFAFDAYPAPGAWSISGLAAGEYYYLVSGSYEGFGSYLLNSSFTAVIPEPQTYVLLLAGFGVLMASRRVRRA